MKKERKDKKHKYGEAMRWLVRKRDDLTPQRKQEIIKDFYDKSFPAASSKRLASTNTVPSYSDEYLDLMVPLEELEDIKQQLNVSPMVRIKKPDLRKGLPNILLADVSNKPPTLDDYLRLGLSLAQLSEEERKTVQQMLDATLNRKEEK